MWLKMEVKGSPVAIVLREQFKGQYSYFTHISLFEYYCGVTNEHHSNVAQTHEQYMHQFFSQLGSATHEAVKRI